MNRKDRRALRYAAQSAPAFSPTVEPPLPQTSPADQSPPPEQPAAPLNEAEVKRARYTAIEREPDAMGRVIGVRRLRPSEQMKISGLTPELVGSDEIEAVDPDTGEKTGEQIKVSHRLPLQVAASVCEIDRVYIPFPKSRGELDAIFDRLDLEGMSAAMKAFARLTKNDPMPAEILDAAKN